MYSDEMAIAVAVLSYEEFRRMRGASSESADWDAYEDYLSEREGRVMALAMAGQAARLAPASSADLIAGERPSQRGRETPRKPAASEGGAVAVARAGAFFGKTPTAA